MLACARIGAPHTVVFGGFAAESLRDRINDCQAKVVLTQDGALPPRHDACRSRRPSTRRVDSTPQRREGRRLPPPRASGVPDHDDSPAAIWSGTSSWPAPTRAAAQPEIVDAEHPLFILYTSGSTGKPKGVLHTTAGYLAGAHVTTKYVFDLRDDDVYWCTADVGWVTGHSYFVYGPLSNGATCLMYEGAPELPGLGPLLADDRAPPGHRSSTRRRPRSAPSSARARVSGQSDLSSLRLLGSVGEPINPEAWIWYHENIGRRRCPDRGHLVANRDGLDHARPPCPARIACKPGSTGLPFFGVVPEIVNKKGEAVGQTRAACWCCDARGPACCARSGATTSASRSNTSRKSRVPTSPATARARTPTAIST